MSGVISWWRGFCPDSTLKGTSFTYFLGIQSIMDSSMNKIKQHFFKISRVMCTGSDSFVGVVWLSQLRWSPGGLVRRDWLMSESEDLRFCSGNREVRHKFGMRSIMWWHESLKTADLKQGERMTQTMFVWSVESGFDGFCGMIWVAMLSFFVQLLLVDGNS